MQQYDLINFPFFACDTRTNIWNEYRDRGTKCAQKGIRINICFVCCFFHARSHTHWNLLNVNVKPVENIKIMWERKGREAPNVIYLNAKRCLMFVKMLDWHHHFERIWVRVEKTSRLYFASRLSCSSQILCCSLSTVFTQRNVRISVCWQYIRFCEQCKQIKHI